MRLTNTLRQKVFPSAQMILILCASLFFAANCERKTLDSKTLNQQMPRKILWAWERPEDLRFLNPDEFGVAFLAQTLLLKNNEVIFQPRRQSLQIPPNIYLIAVTRIETDRKNSNTPELSLEQQKKVVSLIKKTLELPNVRAVQIDFDALVSERTFYRNFIGELKENLTENTALTMTALASWCVGDAWFSDFPVDEAVPMAFEMGADDKTMRAFLNGGNDWHEPLCRKSYGIAVDEPLAAKFQPNRRFFYFKSKAWEKSDLEKLSE